MGFIEKLKNKKKIKTLEKSAKQDNAESLYELGMIYIDGLIVKQDKILGKKYIARAAELRYLPAIAYLKTKDAVDAVNTTIKTIKTIAQNTNFK